MKWQRGLTMVNVTLYNILEAPDWYPGIKRPDQ